MGRDQIKNAGCVRNRNVVSVRLECVSQRAAEVIFAAIVKAIDAGEVHLDVPATRRLGASAIAEAAQ